MIAWTPFKHNDQVYDLSHLHPQLITYRQAALGNLPERIYEVQVIYSLHCFTSHRQTGAPKDLDYKDSRETRTFDFKRWEHSKQLPAILQSLPFSPCYHTNHGNFFTVKILNQTTGEEESYETFFSASRSGRKPARINLFVESAYVRDRQHQNQPQRKKINFFVILHNTLNNKPIKLPPK